ncbi:phage head-tail connector protein [Mycoplasma gypis]|nr:phage head-tail connector protein [[Mycoplasma] gypis]
MYYSEILDDWAQDAKISLAIIDEFRDTLLREYIEIAHRNILTQYCGYKLAVNEIPNLEDPVAFCLQVKQATIHLAATFLENPDITLQNAQGIVDKRMIYRILGDKVRYE